MSAGSVWECGENAIIFILVLWTSTVWRAPAVETCRLYVYFKGGFVKCFFFFFPTYNFATLLLWKYKMWFIICFQWSTGQQEQKKRAQERSHLHCVQRTSKSSNAQLDFQSHSHCRSEVQRLWQWIPANWKSLRKQGTMGSDKKKKKLLPNSSAWQNRWGSKAL